MDGIPLSTTMPEVLDLHAHVLPGVDDGPASADESVQLARRAAADGVTTLAATPHLRDDHPGVVPEELADRTAELGRLLDQQGVALALVPGGEVDVIWAIDATDDALRLVSYGQRGNDLLVETPYGELPPHFERMLDAVRWRGYRLLLAHPERNPSFQRSPERLADLVNRGVLVQLTAASFARPRGSRSGRLARAAVTEGMAHVIASDAHGFATLDRAGLAEGLALASELDPARAEWMVTDAPAAVLEGAALPPPPASVARRQGIFARTRAAFRGPGRKPSERRR
jgi:protein-tyrosine phosphatase